jgi:hypothetical protein
LKLSEDFIVQVCGLSAEEIISLRDGSSS